MKKICGISDISSKTADLFSVFVIFRNFFKSVSNQFYRLSLPVLR